MAENLPARLEQAYVDIGQHYGYVSCIDEAADRIRELERAIASWLHDGRMQSFNDRERIRCEMRKLLGQSFASDAKGDDGGRTAAP